MAQDLLCKTTNEFSVSEKEQFVALFGRVFGRQLSCEDFSRKYLNTPLGYSHHSLMLADGRLVGAYNLIPYRYHYSGTVKLFGLSVDAMMAPDQRRGPFSFVKMARLACTAASQDGVVFAFGFPNDSAYSVTKKLLRWKDIGELDFYGLPVNIGALCPRLRWVNPLCRLFAKGFVRLPRPGNSRALSFAIEKVGDASFHRHRYDQRHTVVPLAEGGEFVYRVCEEEDGVRALYLIDVVPLTKARVDEAVRRVYAVAASCADIILYVGRLPFRPRGLVRVPPSRRPRNIRMCGRVLDAAGIDDRVFQIDNWNVNISNIDVR